jgi:hypothetical protein
MLLPFRHGMKRHEKYSNSDMSTGTKITRTPADARKILIFDSDTSTCMKISVINGDILDLG